jgi:hypothetical protein
MTNSQAIISSGFAKEDRETMTGLELTSLFPPKKILPKLSQHLVAKKVGLRFFNGSNSVASFFLVQCTKTRKNIPNYYKMYQMAMEYIKWPHDVPKVQIIWQIAVKYTTWT